MMGNRESDWTPHIANNDSSASDSSSSESSPEQSPDLSFGNTPDDIETELEQVVVYLQQLADSEMTKADEVKIRKIAAGIEGLFRATVYDEADIDRASVALWIFLSRHAEQKQFKEVVNEE